MTLLWNDENIDRMKEAERAWHDASYSKHAHSGYPDTPEEFQRVFVKGHLTPFCDGGWSWWSDARHDAVEALGNVRGLRVLDYGCGYGELGIYLSLNGARVWGFDFSRPAIETANETSRRLGADAEFATMDAAALTYPDGFFDRVVGFGVLHHVIKYPDAGSHLFRILKRGGKAVFHETLWDNPVINLARRFTTVDPEAGDAHLTEHEIRGFCREFGSVQLKKCHLLYMLKRFAKPPAADWNAELKPRPFWRMVKKLDSGLLRIKALRRYCGEVVIVLEK